MRKSFHITLIFLGLCTGLFAQDLEWKAGFDGFLDNREYQSIEIPQTIFGSRLHGEIGASLQETHYLMAGLNFLSEFGADPWMHKPELTAYYNLKRDAFEFHIGAFPRAKLLDYPLALLSDTLHYYRPNIQGVSLGFNKPWGYQNVFIDWTSRQTDTLPERFIVGLSGEARFGLLYYNHHIMMGHFAGTTQDGHAVRDNGGFDINLGTDLSRIVALDTLILSAGMLVGLDRDRSNGDEWQTPSGVILRAMVMWKGLGLEGRYYSGDKQTLLYGDPFYRLEKYGRLDIFWAPFRSGVVCGKLNVAMHFAKGQVDFSQQILLSINLGGTRPANPR